MEGLIACCGGVLLGASKGDGMKYDDRVTPGTREHPYFTAIKKLPEPWRSRFPINNADCQAWHCYIERVAMHSRVLVVATTRITGHWKAYCAAVHGRGHREEWEEVLRHGDQLRESWARALFPRWEPVPYAR